MLYGPISSSTWLGDEVTPKQFKSELDALGDVDEIKVYINSDGGDVFAGQAIHSMLKRHKAKVKVYIDGLAASIASVIAMAGDEIYMPSNSMMMLHNPWTLVLGNSEELRKIADDLDKIREGIVAAYQTKTALSKDKIIEMMDAETWMTADEAVRLGFADKVEKEKAVAASLSDGVLVLNGQKFDISKYQKAPKLAFIPPNNKPDPILKIENGMEDEQVNDLFFLCSKQLLINKNRLEATKI
jgi:ATP-dependent Clp protease protease subunit